jgi:AcrR family transcriptional regulator
VSQSTASPGRERLLATASELFYREGIHSVGVDRLLSEAGVTRATMYRHFAGKEALVAAYLSAEDETLRGYVEQAREAGGSPRDLLARVIDTIAADVTRYHTRGCPFINAAAEFPDPDSEIRRIVARHRAWFRSTLEQVAGDAGLDHPQAVAAALVLLRDAALVGGYLDGVEVTAPAFVATARNIAGIES